VTESVLPGSTAFFQVPRDSVQLGSAGCSRNVEEPNPEEPNLPNLEELNLEELNDANRADLEEP
jgi:hypothetical protein